MVERVGKRTAVHPPVLWLAVAHFTLGALPVADDTSRSATDPGPSGPRRRVDVRRRFAAGILAGEFRAGSDCGRTGCEPHYALWGVAGHVQARRHRAGGFRPD